MVNTVVGDRTGRRSRDRASNAGDDGAKNESGDVGAEVATDAGVAAGTGMFTGNASDDADEGDLSGESFACDKDELETDDSPDAAPSVARATDDEVIGAFGFELAVGFDDTRVALEMGAVRGRCDASFDCETEFERSAASAAAGVGLTDKDEDARSADEGRSEAREADDDRFASAETDVAGCEAATPLLEADRDMVRAPDMDVPLSMLELVLLDTDLADMLGLDARSGNALRYTRATCERADVGAGLIELDALAVALAVGASASSTTSGGLAAIDWLLSALDSDKLPHDSSIADRGKTAPTFVEALEAGATRNAIVERDDF
jgi:hypothetical protein